MPNLRSKIPPRIRITRKVTYEVLFVDQFTDEHQLGECRPEEKQILIKNNISDTESFKTFVHEVFHAISFENKDLNLTEGQVSKLEEGVFRLMKLNKLV
jgi:hypothetical protein